MKARWGGKARVYGSSSPGLGVPRNSDSWSIVLKQSWTRSASSHVAATNADKNAWRVETGSDEGWTGWLKASPQQKRWGTTKGVGEDAGTTITDGKPGRWDMGGNGTRGSVRTGRQEHSRRAADATPKRKAGEHEKTGETTEAMPTRRKGRDIDNQQQERNNHMHRRTKANTKHEGTPRTMRNKTMSTARGNGHACEGACTRKTTNTRTTETTTQDATTEQEQKCSTPRQRSETYKQTNRKIKTNIRPDGENSDTQRSEHKRAKQNREGAKNTRNARRHPTGTMHRHAQRPTKGEARRQGKAGKRSKHRRKDHASANEMNTRNHGKRPSTSEHNGRGKLGKPTKRTATGGNNDSSPNSQPANIQETTTRRARGRGTNAEDSLSTRTQQARETRKHHEAAQRAQTNQPTKDTTPLRRRSDQRKRNTDAQANHTKQDREIPLRTKAKDGNKAPAWQYESGGGWQSKAPN